MRLIIVRHGETKLNKERRIQGQLCNSDFTEKGLRQIEKVINKLKKYSIDRVFSCDTPRCLKIAEKIAKLRKIPNLTDQRLRSRTWGILDGKTRGEIAELFPDSGYSIEGQTIDQSKKYYFQPPQGETWFETIQRVEEFVRYFLKNYYSKNTVVIIGHSGVCRVIITYLCNLGKFTLIGKPISNVKFNIFNIKKKKNNKFLIYNFNFLTKYRKTFFNILQI
jgi:broad specificity phosphatase PhoE